MSKLLAYAIDFVSYVMQKLEKKEIQQIIVFGSVAREQAGKESDVDIFIDTEEKNLEKKIKKIKIDFFKSVKYHQYWKLLGIQNEINPLVGKLDAWKDLKPSIIADGIVLYSKFKMSIKEGKHETFFIWENIKPNSVRVLFNKQIFGYVQKDKFYEGLLQKYQGKRLGKGCIVVPLEHSLSFHKLFS